MAMILAFVARSWVTCPPCNYRQPCFSKVHDLVQLLADDANDTHLNDPDVVVHVVRIPAQTLHKEGHAPEVVARFG